MFYVEAADVPGEGAELHFFSLFAISCSASQWNGGFPVQHKKPLRAAKGWERRTPGDFYFRVEDVSAAYIRQTFEVLVCYRAVFLEPPQPPGLASVFTER